MRKQHSPKQWVNKAKSDLTAAVDLLSVESEALDAICFHSQQAAEKYLKAMMAANQMTIPYEHSLPMLMKLLGNLVPQQRDFQKEVAWLSQFAVEVRYPAKSGGAVSKEHAHRALRIAREIKNVAEQQLKNEQ